MADRPEVPPLRLEARRAEESPAASGPASPIERDANILRALEEANAGMEESRAPGAGERPVAVPEAAPHADNDVGEGQTQRPRHFGALSQRQTSRSTGRHSSLTKRENAPRATARTTAREQPPATSAQSKAFAKNQAHHAFFTVSCWCSSIGYTKGVVYWYITLSDFP